MLWASASMHVGATAKLDGMELPGTARKGQVSKKRSIAIDVAPGNWGRADVRDIAQVLESAAGELLAHVGPSRGEISIRVIPRSGSPRVLYERGVDGQYVIQLSARDERWFQYVFQFSHELCHVLSNFDHKEAIGEDKVNEGNQWFEEALCETASLFTLRRLAAAWETNPPLRNWAGDAGMFSAYADHLMGQAHRQLPVGQSLRDWYAHNTASLRESPYLREKNELVAASLLPLFEADPGLWRSIAYLNPGRNSAGKPFAHYVADWQAASPDRTLPDQVIELFGLPQGGQVAGMDAGESPGEKLASAALASRNAMNGPAGD
ncbi:MAG: hypothetical protein M3R45_04720 [Pseudomonadota bacterium]|nr:hypothetical protein [Pseudomonadota bacterium]